MTLNQHAVRHDTEVGLDSAWLGKLPVGQANDQTSAFHVTEPECMCEQVTWHFGISGLT